MEDIEDLKEEIDILKKRISVLEGKENRRKAYSYFKIIIKIILILLIIFGIWKGYNYIVNEIPNMINDSIKNLNPFKIGN